MEVETDAGEHPLAVSGVLVVEGDVVEADAPLECGDRRCCWAVDDVALDLHDAVDAFAAGDGFLNHQVDLVQLPDRVVHQEQHDQELEEARKGESAIQDHEARPDDQSRASDCGERLDDGA